MLPSLDIRTILQATEKMLDTLADGKAPVVLCVVDSTGVLLAFARMDAAPERLAAIALGKAYTAARMQCSTLAFQERLRTENLSLRDFCDSGLTSLPGGVPLRQENVCLGAVGVSGRALHEDAELAKNYAALLHSALATK